MIRFKLMLIFRDLKFFYGFFIRVGICGGYIINRVLV